MQVLGRVLQAEEKRQDDDTVKIAVTLWVKDVNGKAVKAREKILVNLYIDDERAQAGAKVNAAGLVAGDEIRVFGLSLIHILNAMEAHGDVVFAAGKIDDLSLIHI